MTNKSIQSRLAAIFITVMMSLMMQHPATAQSIHPNLTCYTELDGLPAPEVSRIIQDQFGYIWAGSINGLTRFDGYEFKRFYSNPNDPGSIRGLWFTRNPAVLSHYDPSEDTRLIYKPEEQPVGASGDFRFNVVKFDKVNKIHKFKKYRIYYLITYFKN